MDEYYMEQAIKEAKKAYKKGEVPVGAIIVKDNKIISKAYNKKESKNNVINHAEILAISKACKKLKNWRLDGCKIYVTMEPCMMCCGAIEQSRISEIIYGISNDNYGYTKAMNNIKIISQIKEKACKNIIQLFFKKRR